MSLCAIADGSPVFPLLNYHEYVGLGNDLCNLSQDCIGYWTLYRLFALLKMNPSELGREKKKLYIFASLFKQL